MNFGDLDDFSESTLVFLVLDVVSSALLRFLSDELPMVLFCGLQMCWSREVPPNQSIDHAAGESLSGLNF